MSSLRVDIVWLYLKRLRRTYILPFRNYDVELY
jgi:hypothetical protein